MRIHDDESDRTLDSVTLFLTRSEAEYLQGLLPDLLAGTHHGHVSSADFEKELTVCVYDPGVLEGFSDRAKRIILDDK